LPHIL
jgi:hypothetical protein